MTRSAFAVVLGAALLPAGTAGRASGPQPPASTGDAARLILVGDTGTGDERARRVAARIARHADDEAVSHLFLLGDNVYEEGDADLIGPRFLDVYRPVLEQGVAIHAALGNHDVEECRDSEIRPVPADGSAYAPAPDCWVEEHLVTPEFGYREGRRYYSIEIGGDPLPGTAPDASPPPLLEIFVLDSNTLGAQQQKLEDGTDEPQLRWLADALERSRAAWRVVVLHHPMVAPVRCRWLWFGCRGADAVLRTELEPILRAGEADVVFQAHQHLYARMKPRGGIRYFVSGAGAKSPDRFRPDPRTVDRPDRGAFLHFVIVEATRERLAFRVVDAEGTTRDRGAFGPHEPVEPRSARQPASPR